MKKNTFIVYSQINEENFTGSLGMPEYSYYFVLRGFLPVLQELGKVIVVNNPEQEVDTIYDECRNRGERCRFISFAPPNKSATGLRCPTLCVVAWEYSRIPDEVWDNEPKNDWRTVFADHGRAVTLSHYSADVVRKAMGADFNVVSIPTPVWDNFEPFRNRSKGVLTFDPCEISINGNVVDSQAYKITPDSIEPLKSFSHFEIADWIGESINLAFTQTDVFSGYLGGFYKSEAWGTWSRSVRPWIFVPYHLVGNVKIKMTAIGYGCNVNKRISISLGSEKKSVVLKDALTEIEARFYLDKPDNIIRFSGLDLTSISGALDSRSMGIGVQQIEISGDPGRNNSFTARRTKNSIQRLALKGVVYTSVFCPNDGRKNWRDMVTAFCTAFQDVEDVTLVLKMSDPSLYSFLGELHFLLQQSSPFKCRVVALHGYMDGAEYEKLVSITHYYVNTSRCEGLCLPLMEFMACRKPAIAPNHTAMADYIDTGSTFIVDSTVEPCMWPHDPRNLFRAFRYRIDWNSLVNAYRQSYDIIKKRPEEYKRMAEIASVRIKTHASNASVKEKLVHCFPTADTMAQNH